MSYETVRTENNLEAEQRITIRRKMHRLWITCNRFEIGAGRLIRLGAPLAPTQNLTIVKRRRIVH
jgi:hypothetical protein